MNITSVFQKAVEKEASDIHLVPGYYPALRINNQILYLRDEGVILETDSALIPKTLLNENQKHIFFENKEIDFGYTYNNVRFRVNLYMTRGLCAGSFRIVPTIIRTIRELNLPDIFYDFTQYRQGLILFSGPTGEGKSTSLASIINELNVRDSHHIITIEDPIEFIYPAARSIVSQRELLQDTLAWSTSLKSVLREDPDVLLVGEMRDYETIQSVLTVAETGHLVFSTLHTGSAVEAINRIIDVFPAHQQNQIRSSLASSLIAVVSQRLLPTINGTGRIPAVEVLLNKPSVSSLIREGKSHQLDNVIETSESDGMILFEKYLLKLYTLGHISRETAHAYAIRKNIIQKLII
jgi:twitching motility protein PilT